MEEYILNNGVKMPKIGLGTWLIDNEKIEEVVKNAISVGYRLIDTAQAYGNEEGIGKAIKECGLKREELFIATKIRAEYKSYEEAKKSIDESLQKMGLDYLDLVIIHSPQPWTDFRENEKRFFEENILVWKALEDAYKEKKVRAIGVSNFLKDDLENILKNCEIKPMVNQILTHISNTNFELIKYCEENNIQVEAYSPIGHGALLNNEILVEMAKKYQVSVPQLCIKYVLQLGAIAIPKATSLENLKSNINVDFEISKEDMEILKNVEKIKDYGKDSHFPVFNKGK